MLIPALFVADVVRKAALSREPAFDIMVFVPGGDVDGTHRAWAGERAIALRHDIDISSVRGIAILQSRLSAATLVKLLLPEHLAGRYDKILYLDADLVIEGDVGALFRLDMGKRAVAAVPSGRVWADVTEEKKDWWLAHFRALGMTPPYGYFNSGVLLIDLASWNREQLTRRTLEFIRKNADICFLPDEDALNAVLDGDLIELSPIWNARPTGPLSFSTDEVRPVIVHYAGPLKPWIRFKKGKGLFQHLEAYRLYEEFVRGTPWSGWLRQQWTVRDLIRAARHEAKGLLERLIGREPGISEAERQSRLANVRQFYAETRFADVEQGITLREGSRLRLAPMPPPGGSAASLASEPRGLAL
jgi:lipopolysaccharide biosynthesis glycosyltransferase